MTTVLTLAEGMTTADWALVVSMFALTISLLGFIWNVWSKFIYPKAKTSNTWMELPQDLAPNGKSIFLLECVNAGPTDLVIRFPVVPTKFRSMFSRNVSYWSLERASGLPNGGTALTENIDWPRKLAVGETMSVIVKSDAIISESHKKPLGLGFIDTFERFHVIPRKAFKVLLNKAKYQQ